MANSDKGRFIEWVNSKKSLYGLFAYLSTLTEFYRSCYLRLFYYYKLISTMKDYNKIYENKRNNKNNIGKITNSINSNSTTKIWRTVDKKQNTIH